MDILEGESDYIISVFCMLTTASHLLKVNLSKLFTYSQYILHIGYITRAPIFQLNTLLSSMKYWLSKPWRWGNSRNLEDRMSRPEISQRHCLFNHCYINYNEVISSKIGSHIMY